MALYDLSVNKRDGSKLNLSELKNKVVKRYFPTYEPINMEKDIIDLL